jgi:predicted metalloendopeptidase
MRQDIDAAPWMSGETKKAAMVKLERSVDRIGYPDDVARLLQHPRHARRGARQPAAALLFNRQARPAKIGQPSIAASGA